MSAGPPRAAGGGVKGLPATDIDSLVRGALWSLGRDISVLSLSPWNRTPTLPGEFIIPTFQKREMERGCGWVAL